MVAGGSIQVIASCSGEPIRAPIRVSDTLFRIGQEALANAVRHSHPTVLKVSLAFESDSLTLRVEDNGKGFFVDSHTLGFGIRGMRNRADQISADLEIRSTIQGTCVMARAPLPSAIRTPWPISIWYSLWEHRFHEQGKRKEADSAFDRR